MAMFLHLIAALLLLSGTSIAKNISRSKRGAVTCVCIAIDCSCRPYLSSRLLPQGNPSAQRPPTYPVGSQSNLCYENCFRSCAQSQQQCQISCQRSWCSLHNPFIFSGQSVGQYGPGASIPPYNEPQYFIPRTTQAPQYIPESAPYSPSGAVISSGAVLEQPTTCVQICMPSCATQCIQQQQQQQQQQQPIPVVQPAPLGPGPVVRPSPGPFTPTPRPTINVPPYQQPYTQPTPVVSSNVGSTVCIEICMPGCSAECLQQNPAAVPVYTSASTYLPQPHYETPLPSATQLPPYQAFTPTPIPQFPQAPASANCLEVCMPSCNAQCIEQQQQPSPYLSQSWPYQPVQQQPVQLQPIAPQSLQVTLPQSIQYSPECVTLCRDACLQQCSQQNIPISQCSSPCLSTCSQNCPASQPVTSTPAYVPLQEPIPVVQSQPIAQSFQYLPTQCQPSAGGATKCSCPSGFIRHSTQINEYNSSRVLERLCLNECTHGCFISRQRFCALFCQQIW
uniref:Keratinocyte proline-rich protein n=1 Tax=Ascaris lumbricoides TaxID=6252 RepID=A0A0M3HPZ0_ASCLU